MARKIKPVELSDEPIEPIEELMFEVSITPESHQILETMQSVEDPIPALQKKILELETDRDEWKRAHSELQRRYNKLQESVNAQRAGLIR